MFKNIKKIRHTEENHRLFEFTIKAYCDLARNAKTDNRTDDKLKEHLYKIISQVGIPNYESFEYLEEDLEDLEEGEITEIEPDFIKIHDKRAGTTRAIKKITHEN